MNNLDEKIAELKAAMKRFGGTSLHAITASFNTLTELMKTSGAIDLAGKDEAVKLYKELRATVEKDNVIALSNECSFPLEVLKKNTNVLLTRKSHVELYELFNLAVLNGDSPSMLLLGTTGVGKSWAGMYFLHKLINEGKTVVYENVQLYRTIVFRNDGDCRIIEERLTKKLCPELKDPKTVHIFDAKAGQDSYQPFTSAAKLLFISSTNEESIGQTSRGSNLVLVNYPSATEEEFYFSAEKFGVNPDVRDEIERIGGCGKVRPLFIDEYESQIDFSIQHFNLNTLYEYHGLNNYPSGQATPALLVDSRAKDMNIDLIISESNTVEMVLKQLKQKYSYYKADWFFSSDYIKRKIGLKFGNFSDVLVAKLNEALKDNMNRAVGVLVGSLHEFLSPKRIVEYGISYESLPIGSSSPIFELGKGLTVEVLDELDTVTVIEKCKDPAIIYYFCKKQEGFDAFIPPNYFIQCANTSGKGGKHSILYSSALKCCINLASMDVNYITAVNDTEKEKWKTPQSFKINDESAVDAINATRDVGDKIKFNGVISYDKLPPQLKANLSNFRQFVGYVHFPRNHFSTLSPQCNRAISMLPLLIKFFK